jgi:chromosome segregation protein
MQLKQMKISGFKSFVDPVTIHLPSQLIAIVGPNGCGKSNIIDAVRWVLGESSAKNLRGDAMTDVIFNGASTRRAVGQASVELRFDNQLGKIGGQFNQYQEIAIKRTVNRDGDSAYYLNGKRCRKRDIIDIFLGTGAGSRGYSIISQGTISQLIEAKPLTLRSYLEEAAGISKYKERRRETLQRIEHTKANLARIHDISQELDKQVQRLQKQAKTAEKYLQLKQEATHCRIKISAYKWQHHHTQRTLYQQQLEELTRKITDLKQQRASFINEATKAQASLQDQQHLFNQKQQAYYEQQSKLARIEEHALMREKEQQAITSQIHQAQQDAQQIAQTTTDEQSQLNSCQQQLEQTEKLLVEMNQTYEQALGDLNHLEHQQQEQTQAYQQLISQQQTLNHSQQLTQLKIDQLNDKQQQWMIQVENTDSQELTKTIEHCQNQAQQLEKTLHHYEKSIEALETDIQSHITDERGHQQSLQTIKKTIKDLEADYQHLLRQKTIVDASIEANSGKKEQSIPSFLQQQTPVFQTITVAEEWQAGFQWIASFLLHGYLVENTQDLLSHKAQLSQSGLVLCQSNPPKKSVQGQTLADVIDGPIPDTNLKLSTIYLAESIEEAYAKIDSLANDASILTKDGYWLGKTWLQCMPADNEASVNLLALVQDQKRLNQSLEDLSNQISLYQQKHLESENNLQEIGHSIKATQAALSQQRQEQQKTQTELTLCQRQQKQAEMEKIRLNELSLQYHTEIESIVSERLLLEKQLESTQTQQSDLALQLNQFEHLSSQAETVKLKKETVMHYHQQLQQHQLMQKQLQQTEQNSKQQLTYWQSQQEKLAARLTQLNDSLADLGNKQESDDKANIDDLKTEQKSNKLLLDQLQADIEQQKQTISSYLQQADSLLQQANDVEHLFQAAQLQKQEATIRLEEAQNQLDQYAITIEEAITHLTETDTIEHLNQLLSHNENRLQLLGGVNLAAKAELDEEIARKQALDAQQVDLESAIESLNQAINKIDQETKTRFNETFEQVNKTFQHLFPTVFGGGKASLTLEGDDWLESGVMVMAQPPGKRNTTIQLLSGGEKALTAVALVFALFQLNPSPFCLLDEVDAPLDDANVGRFCQLVKQMSDQVQFLIITHNKVTMTLAKHLIGVTMREPGVSRLVAVDVAEAIELSAK